MLITQKEYDSIFKGYYINGVAIRDTGYIYLTIREKRDDIDPTMEEKLAKKKFVAFYHDEPLGEQWGARRYEAFNKIYSAAITVPLSQYIGVDRNSEVYVIGSGIEELEDPIPGEHAIMNTRSIGGELYVVGGGRYIARRRGKNDWEILSNGIKKTTRKEHLYSAGFDCLDGFSESDIYAGGGKGDLWHFDGEEWRQIDFPGNMSIESICCGQDGFVYIGAQNGTIFKGKADQWSMIHKGTLSLPFRQMVWFQDRIWAVSDYGIWQIIDDQVVSPDLPPEVTLCSGYISCTDEILAIAGMNGAARLQNGQWDVLVNCIQAEKS